jgi:hypothetical protein
VSRTKDRRQSGPSGAHKNPGILLRATPEQRVRWETAARERNLTLSAWLRLAADRQTERKTLG